MKASPAVVACLCLASAAPAYLAGRAAGSREALGASRPGAPATAGRTPLQTTLAGRSEPAAGTAANADDLVPRTLPSSEDEIKACRDRIAASLKNALTAGDRMMLVARILSAMTPENAWLIREAFGQSWDEGCHFHPEHDLMWGRLGEVLGAEAADKVIKPGGPFWPVYGKLLEGWARSDPRGIAHWLMAHPDHSGRQQVIESTVRGMASVDPAATIDILLGLEGREQAIAAAAAERGSGNLGGAPGADRLRDALAARPRQHIDQVFGAAARNDAPHAVYWAESLARRHPEQSEQAYDAIASTWFAADPRAMSQWLNSARDHPASDAMTVRLVRQIAADDPEAARAWAARIKDPALRTKALAQSGQRSR